MWRGKTSHLSFALRKDSWIDFPSLRRSWSFRCRAKVRTLLEVKRTRPRASRAGAKCRLSLFAAMDSMSPELMFWFALATKMVVTALFVSVATIVAERLGATVGALVATL